MAYGRALKDRVLRFYDEGEQTKDIAKRLKVSASWCRRVRQRRHDPPRKIGGGHFKLDDAGRHALADWVKERPDATLEELRRRCLDELDGLDRRRHGWRGLYPVHPRRAGSHAAAGNGRGDGQLAG